MQENISSIVAIVASIITTCTLIYNTFFKGSFKREREYYKKILIPFVENLKAGNEGALQGAKNQIKRTDECVPKYIMYLVNISQNQTDNTINDEKLSKVLIYDYLDIYPNDDNKLNRLARIITKVFTYLILFLAFGFLIMGSIYFANVVDNLILSKTGKLFDLSSLNISKEDGYGIVLGIICFLLYFGTVLLAKSLNRDRYTTNKRKIEKIIRKSVNTYDKRHDKYVY